MNAGLATDSAVGDFDAGFDGAEVKIDQRLHDAVSVFAAHGAERVPGRAARRGSDVSTSAPRSSMRRAPRSPARCKIDPQRIHFVAPYVGGGFGSKLGIHCRDDSGGARRARAERPVKVAMTRQQIFQLIGVRPTSSQRVRLGAERDGRLVAIGHDATMHTSPLGSLSNRRAVTRAALYAAPNRLTRHRLVPLDLPRGEDVRAPGEAPGLLALESAMDELAHALDMDPVELRIRNEPARPSRDRCAVQRAPSGRVHARRSTALRLGPPSGDARRACARADGWSAMAWPPQSACTSSCRPRRAFGWAPTASPSSCPT